MMKKNKDKENIKSIFSFLGELITSFSNDSSNSNLSGLATKSKSLSSAEYWKRENKKKRARVIWASGGRSTWTK